MSNEDKYLDLEGLQTYHSELVKDLTNLEYDPERMFKDMRELLTPKKWGSNKYGIVVGLKNGLMVTVGNKIWQLEDAENFGMLLRKIESIDDKLVGHPTPDTAWWKLVGSDVDFGINDHILRLVKK